MEKKICSVPYCGKIVKARGYCNKHLQQVDMKGAVYSRIKLRCMVPDCENKYMANGYCDKHMNQVRKTGAVFSVRRFNECSAPGCSRPHYSYGYCSKHWRQIRDAGRLFEVSRGEPNQVVFDGDIARIFLYGRKSKKVGEAIIDAEDYPMVKDYKWKLGAQGYVTRNCEKGQTPYMHRIILDVGEGMEVDHKNRDRLYNRKCNLRPCNRMENSSNSSLSSRNTSGFTGVSWDKKSGAWDTYIKHNYTFIRLGLYDNIEDAARVRRAAELKYFKEFAPKRIPSIQIQ